MLKLAGILLTYSTLAWAAYYPFDPTIPALQSPQEPPQPPPPSAPQIAWLEYLGQMYLEVHNYRRAQKCVDEIRRLSGVSLGDASLSRLAIDGLSRRMRGFRAAPPRRSRRHGLLGRSIGSPRNKRAAKRQAMLQSEYMSRLASGEGWRGSNGPNMPRAYPTYYTFGSPTQPGPSFGIETSQAAAMRRMLECPACRDEFEPPQQIRQMPQPISNLYSYPPSPVRMGPRKNRMKSGKVTDIHKLLFEGRVEEANALFAKLIKSGTSAKRPVYRIELVLSLIDMDMLDHNDCVPLWDASWRLSWRDKLRIVDVYRSCDRFRKSSPFLPDVLFYGLRRLRFREQVEVRIKTILDTTDALYMLSRVPTKPDFYSCGACWARRHGGMEKMQRFLIRAEHDSGLSPGLRRHYSQVLQTSFDGNVFDPRARLFNTVFPRDLAFSVITGEYSGLYYASDGDSMFSDYGRFFGRSRYPSNGYRPLKNPNPIPRDRQQVLLDALASGSPEQLARLMNNDRHRLVKNLMNDSHALSFDDLEHRHSGKQENRKKRSLFKKIFGRKKSKNKNGAAEAADRISGINQEAIREYEKLNAEREELLQHLQQLLDRAMRHEQHFTGSDQFGMAFHDYGTQPLSKHEHKMLLRRIAEAKRRLQELHRRAAKQGVEGEAEQAAYEEQMEYLEQIYAAQEALHRLHKQLQSVEQRFSEYS